MVMNRLLIMMNLLQNGGILIDVARSEGEFGRIRFNTSSGG